MKKQANPRMRMVSLDPLVVQLIDHVCKVEGLTRMGVFEALLRQIRAEKESKP